MREHFLEFLSFMKCCEQLEYNDINCYILKTMFNLSKNIMCNKYEIILEAYTLLLRDLDYIKNRYDNKKSSFKTYIYFYIRKYLYSTYEKYKKKYEYEIDAGIFSDEQYDYMLEKLNDNEDIEYNI